MHEAIDRVLSDGAAIGPGKGRALELRGVLLELTDPRARLSRSETRGRVFSTLGEWCWYLSGSAETKAIAYYIDGYNALDEGGVVWGAYGPRLRSFDGTDQLARVCDQLRTKPDTRQAVIQVFDHADLDTPHEDVPCTCTLQFFARNEVLDLMVHMRSNDAYLGLPHDVFSFTMIQELVACDLGIDLGRYIHAVGSFHLYDRHRSGAAVFLREGWYEPTGMVAMPSGSPWSGVDYLLRRERELRSGELDPLAVADDDNSYWGDLVRLLAMYALHRAGRFDERALLREGMTTNVFDTAIADKAGL
jgi:thymidylate synthase